MIFHIEDPSKSGSFKRNNWWYHYATLCGMTFRGGGHEHRIVDPDAAPTCEDCKAVQSGVKG